MAQVNTTVVDMAKEVWTADRLQEQFYKDVPLLDKLLKSNKFTIGKQAQVPIHGGLGGGDTSVTAGTIANLNVADRQRLDQATYTLKEQWRQVELAAGTMIQHGGGAQSVANVIELEVSGSLTAMRRSIMRQLASNGDGLIAQCGTTTASTEVELSTSGFGFDALKRGWLRPGMLVDIGTTASSDSIASDRTITAVEKNAASPSITISGAAVTTSTSHFVSIANPNTSAGARNPETNGLRSIVSTTEALGGLDPQSAGEEFWTAASVNSTDTAITTDVLLDLQREVLQETGSFQPTIVFSLKQQARFYAYLQTQERYNSDKLTAGNVDGVTWSGMPILAVPDIVDREVYLLHVPDLLVVCGKYKAPMWASDIEGAGGRLRWQQGTTAFRDGLVFSLDFGVNRRNSHAAATNLTA